MRKLLSCLFYMNLTYRNGIYSGGLIANNTDSGFDSWYVSFLLHKSLISQPDIDTINFILSKWPHLKLGKKFMVYNRQRGCKEEILDIYRDSSLPIAIKTRELRYHQRTSSNPIHSNLIMCLIGSPPSSDNSHWRREPTPEKITTNE